MYEADPPVSLVVMWWLALAKRRIGLALGSRALAAALDLILSRGGRENHAVTLAVKGPDLHHALGHYCPLPRRPLVDEVRRALDAKRRAHALYNDGPDTGAPGRRMENPGPMGLNSRRNGARSCVIAA